MNVRKLNMLLRSYSTSKDDVQPNGCSGHRLAFTPNCHRCDAALGSVHPKLQLVLGALVLPGWQAASCSLPADTLPSAPLKCCVGALEPALKLAGWIGRQKATGLRVGVIYHGRPAASWLLMG